jgi:hypothetical protein
MSKTVIGNKRSVRVQREERSPLAGTLPSLEKKYRISVGKPEKVILGTGCNT